MTLENVAPRPTSRVKTTIDTILLTTLLNRELNADGKVFNVEIEYVPSNGSWQACVECFRNTYMPIITEEVAKQAGAEAFVKKLAEQLRNVMLPKQVTGIKEPRPKPTTAPEEGKK